jgi:hypothetical protein
MNLNESHRIKSESMYKLALYPKRYAGVLSVAQVLTMVSLVINFSLSIHHFVVLLKEEHIPLILHRTEVEHSISRAQSKIRYDSVTQDSWYPS